MSDSTLSGPRRLAADRFHSGVRFGALVAWFASIVVVFFMLRAVASALLGSVSGIGVLLVGILAVLLAQPLAWLAERALMNRWPSGRSVTLAPNRLEWNDRGQMTVLDLRQKLNYWRWRFQVRRARGGRVPTGHHCLAVRLVQGDNVLSLYTFLAPAVQEALTEQYAFYELRRSADNGKQSLGGRDAMFLAAEHTRWESGAELDADDFQALLAHLAASLPEFEKSPTSGG